MSICILGSCCSCESDVDTISSIPTPNPNLFDIKQMRSIGNFVIALIYYNGCTNYEGKKILVFKNVTIHDIQNMSQIDPHFCDSHKHISPIARFVPTDEGWNMAEKFCHSIDDCSDRSENVKTTITEGKTKGQRCRLNNDDIPPRPSSPPKMKLIKLKNL